MRFDDDPKANLWFNAMMIHALLGIPVGLVLVIAGAKFILLGGTTVNYINETHTTTTTVDAKTDCGWLSWSCSGGDKGE